MQTEGIVFVMYEAKTKTTENKIKKKKSTTKYIYIRPLTSNA